MWGLSPFALYQLNSIAVSNFMFMCQPMQVCMVQEMNGKNK